MKLVKINIAIELNIEKIRKVQGENLDGLNKLSKSHLTSIVGLGIASIVPSVLSNYAANQIKQAIDIEYEQIEANNLGLTVQELRIKKEFPSFFNGGFDKWIK